MISNIAEARTEVPKKLEDLLKAAQTAWDATQSLVPSLSPELTAALDYMHDQASNASTAFTNILTALAVKATFPSIDVRYHQEQIQNQTPAGAGFSFRTLSEKEIYPWLRDHQFDGAKSGWQTRTFERDDPYTLNFKHNIGGTGSKLKPNFLLIYDRIEEKGEDAAEALTYLLFLQIQKRHIQTVDLAVPRTNNISLIVELFERHFFHAYSGKGASRLPVLAMFALYEVIGSELRRFENTTLRELAEHSAADARTGAVGDIEVEADDGSLLEAIEVKHGQKIDDKVMTDVEEKVSRTAVKRYYVLTTHKDAAPDEAAAKRIARIFNVYDCVVIANGVQATLRYYLRLASDPSAIFPLYIALLNKEAAIGHEHRAAWNEVVESIST